LAKSGIGGEFRQVGCGNASKALAAPSECQVMYFWPKFRALVPAHYDAFRLHVSSSYRELFDRAVTQVLKREGWEIVPTEVCKSWARRYPICYAKSSATRTICLTHLANRALCPKGR